MELVLLVLKINKAKVWAIFLILQIIHAYDRKTRSPPLPKKHYPYSYFPKMFTVLLISTVFSVLYPFKNGIVFYLLLCNLFWFFFSLSILGTSCHCPQMRFFHILSESYLFSIELNSALLLHSLIVFSFFAVINKASLNEYPCV